MNGRDLLVKIMKLGRSKMAAPAPTWGQQAHGVYTNSIAPGMGLGAAIGGGLGAVQGATDEDGNLVTDPLRGILGGALVGGLGNLAYDAMSPEFFNGQSGQQAAAPAPAPAPTPAAPAAKTPAARKPAPAAPAGGGGGAAAESGKPVVIDQNDRDIPSFLRAGRARPDRTPLSPERKQEHLERSSADAAAHASSRAAGPMTEAKPGGVQDRNRRLEAALEADKPSMYERVLYGEREPRKPRNTRNLHVPQGGEVSATEAVGGAMEAAVGRRVRSPQASVPDFERVLSPAEATAASMKPSPSVVPEKLPEPELRRHPRSRLATPSSQMAAVDHVMGKPSKPLALPAPKLPNFSKLSAVGVLRRLLGMD